MVISFLYLWISLVALKAFAQASADAWNGSVYENPTYSPEERARDLLGRLTWQEKVAQMGGMRQSGRDVRFNLSRTIF
jgi:hypothetical protein